jgi:hypothetical protein
VPSTNTNRSAQQGQIDRHRRGRSTQIVNLWLPQPFTPSPQPFTGETLQFTINVARDDTKKRKSAKRDPTEVAPNAASVVEIVLCIPELTAAGGRCPSARLGVGKLPHTKRARSYEVFGSLDPQFAAAGNRAAATEDDEDSDRDSNRLRDPSDADTALCDGVAAVDSHFVAEEAERVELPHPESGAAPHSEVQRRA